MRKIFLFALTILTFLSLTATRLYAAGMVMSNSRVQVVPTEARALIVYDGTRETIFDSLTFNVNPIIAWNFAWLIVTPSEPDVKFVSDELLPKAEKVSEKTLEKKNLADKLLYFDVEEEGSLPTPLFTRPVDLLSLEVIEPDSQVKKLKIWLSDYGYLIPKEANHLLDEYEKKGWYFVVMEVNANHLQLDATESLTVPGAHTLPVMISFETDKIVYPLKLASVQPDYDSQDITLNYQYGTSSEQVLGESDERVDDILSTPSANTYPRTPFDYLSSKVELFVLADSRVENKAMTTSYANWVDKGDIQFKGFNDQDYFVLPRNKMFLTRLYAYTPVMQLADLELMPTGNNIVNGQPTKMWQIVKLSLVPLLTIFLWVIKRRFFSRKSDRV